MPAYHFQNVYGCVCVGGEGGIGGRWVVEGRASSSHSDKKTETKAKSPESLDEGIGK